MTNWDSWCWFHQSISVPGLWMQHSWSSSFSACNPHSSTLTHLCSTSLTPFPCFPSDHSERQNIGSVYVGREFSFSQRSDILMPIGSASLSYSRSNRREPTHPTNLSSSTAICYVASAVPLQRLRQPPPAFGLWWCRLREEVWLWSFFSFSHCRFWFYSSVGHSGSSGSVTTHCARVLNCWCRFGWKCLWVDCVGVFSRRLTLSDS